MCAAVLQAAAVAEAELRSRVPASSPSSTNEQPRHYKVRSQSQIATCLLIGRAGHLSRDLQALSEHQPLAPTAFGMPKADDVPVVRKAFCAPSFLFALCQDLVEKYVGSQGAWCILCLSKAWQVCEHFLQIPIEQHCRVVLPWELTRLWNFHMHLASSTA